MRDNNTFKEIKLELVSCVVAGSVDDGKSTLIGRMLFDLNKIYIDQINSIREMDKINKEIDYSLFTDGLLAEREQKITIDVAYRYFSTNKRRYIILDVPGHEQYTKNMFTGASKADVGLILVDANKGMQIQTRRHLYLIHLLGIKKVAIIINKMDSVQYSSSIFYRIEKECLEYAQEIGLKDLIIIPVSSLNGDMIVERKKVLSWYKGPTVIEYLENVRLFIKIKGTDVRFPIQHVIRPNDGFRGYAGRLAGGTIRVGNFVKVLSSGKLARIKEIFLGEKKLEEAMEGQSILITLDKDLDISRGDMLIGENDLAKQSNSFFAYICWFNDRSLQINQKYIIKHNCISTPCFVDKVEHVIKMEDLKKQNNGRLSLNDIGLVLLKTQKSLVFDEYITNRDTGSFIIIDESSNETVGAGLMVKSQSDKQFFRRKEIINDIDGIDNNFDLEQKVELSKIIIEYVFLKYRNPFVSCSFGKDSRVIIDLAMKVNKSIKFIGIDTGYEFVETLDFAKMLVKKLGMNFLWVKPNDVDIRKIEEKYGDKIIIDNQYKCCAMKKPALQKIITQHDAWITGLRRDESVSRQDIPIIEETTEVIKINPIAFWTRDDVWNYIKKNNLDVHPLYQCGYTSLGCQPCTKKSINIFSEERTGRFIGTDNIGQECGLHDHNT